MKELRPNQEHTVALFCEENSLPVCVKATLPHIVSAVSLGHM